MNLITLMFKYLAPFSICAALVAAPFFPKPPTIERIDVSSLSYQLRKAEIQLSLLSASFNKDEWKYYRDVFLIETALSERAVDPRMARQIAWLIVKEAEKQYLTGKYISAIMQVENPWLKPDTVSRAGAVGLMQVMPLHLSKGHECGDDLTNEETSICFGAMIFSEYLADEIRKAINRTLLRYNGCINTPGCKRYADWVLRRVN